ncbi:uncharacterized protein N7469_008292 [Penicillium citrinum]|uniref:Uncharacterized protein n=1 Tax=Penicillium citrinum TaxID=5077 RepID=A0A9W9NRL0_PENCI|nr:uncharacterized protein N7469_008292 [Penicillium citrinum]KAJ5224789.1 hypothetical protein N7469_008292 [Penicillium citrinum]
MPILSSLNTIASLALVSLAEYRPEERFVLAERGIHGANGESTSRQIMYYPTAPWASLGTRGKWVTLETMTDVPWGGSYPWRLTGVTRKMPNGDDFTVVVDPSVPDSDDVYPGLAWHTFESHLLPCYGHHERGIYTLDDGTECASAYICDPSTPPTPSPDLALGPAPPAVQKSSTLTLI